MTSNRLTWLLAAVAVFAIGVAVALGVLYSKEGHDVACQKSAADADRAALVRLETSQRDHLRAPSQHTAADVVGDIQHFLATVRADDRLRAAC